MQGVPLEIERKFLIAYPDTALLEAQPGCSKTEIAQTYLSPAPDGAERRVRRRGLNGVYTYTCTEKIFLTPVRRVEREREISEAEYEVLLKEKKEEYDTLYKTRYAIPFAGLVCEVDVYPFISDWAVMEIEMEEEETALSMPPFVQVLKEVTGVKEYGNAYLARRKTNE